MSRANNSPKNVMWRVLCDCGMTKTVLAQNLRSGTSRSCGCLQRDRRSLHLTGKKFGRIKVIRWHKKDKRGKYIWEYICDCGTSGFARGSDLVSGGTKSCGCLHTERSSKMCADRKLDLSGRRFGRLVAVRDSGKRHKKEGVFWECVCDCGGNRTTSASHLMRGTTRSCGCITAGRNFATPAGLSWEDIPPKISRAVHLISKLKKAIKEKS